MPTRLQLPFNNDPKEIVGKTRIAIYVVQMLLWATAQQGAVISLWHFVSSMKISSDSQGLTVKKKKKAWL